MARSLWQMKLVENVPTRLWEGTVLFEDEVENGFVGFVEKEGGNGRMRGTVANKTSSCRGNEKVNNRDMDEMDSRTDIEDIVNTSGNGRRGTGVGSSLDVF